MQTIDSSPDIRERARGSATSRRRRLVLQLVTPFFGLVLGLIAAEAGLRIVENSRIGDRATPSTIEDPLLGNRVLPSAPGHDANGFRNVSVPRQAEIVVLGDSQTWGINAQSYESWPRQLERMSGLSVYNMATGGYGPVQYLMLTDKALSFSPRLIVVGLYFGNDIYDAYALAYANDHYVNLRNPQAPPDLTRNTVKTGANDYWDEEKNFHKNFGRSSISGLSYWLREHSAIGRLLNRAHLWPGATDIDYEIDRQWVQSHPDHGAVCEEENIRTVFTTAYRLTALDLDEPRVAEGLRLTKLAIAQIKQKVTGANTKLLVVLIPTKELVYSDIMQRAGRLTGSYSRLVEMEHRARFEVEEWCDDQQVDYLDALPALAAATGRRERMYPSTTDSHPNPSGYSVIAAAVNEKIKNSGLTSRAAVQSR